MHNTLKISTVYEQTDKQTQRRKPATLNLLQKQIKQVRLPHVPDQRVEVRHTTGLRRHSQSVVRILLGLSLVQGHHFVHFGIGLIRPARSALNNLTTKSHKKANNNDEPHSSTTTCSDAINEKLTIAERT